MNNAIAQPKKLGRKPLPEEKKRMRIGCRISPGTMEFLSGRMEDQHVSMGKAIDWAVSVADKALQQPLETEGTPKDSVLPTD